MDDAGSDGSDFLSQVELSDALRGLATVELLRLRRRARYLAGDDAKGQDLLGQAILLALNGSRRCPRDVSPATFLFNVMRSVISWVRRRQVSGPAFETLDATGTEGVAARLPSGERNAEEAMLIAEDCDSRMRILEASFGDDDDAMGLIVGILSGMTAAEIREQLGFDETKYGTIRRRIRRRLDKATAGATSC